jgi:hypothetical protein
MTVVHGVHGPQMTPTYLIGIRLDRTIITDLRATLAELEGADVLIGMDVITLGDFAVTNENGTTTFSFRIPSLHTVDYVDEANRNRQRQSTGRGGGNVNPANRNKGRRR